MNKLQIFLIFLVRKRRSSEPKMSGFVWDRQVDRGCEISPLVRRRASFVARRIQYAMQEGKLNIKTSCSLPNGITDMNTKSITVIHHSRHLFVCFLVYLHLHCLPPYLHPHALVFVNAAASSILRRSSPMLHLHRPTATLR